MFEVLWFTLFSSVSYTVCWIPVPHTLYRNSLNFKEDFRYKDVDPGEPLILTPYIENNDPTAKSLSEVKHPEFYGKTSFSGFLTVNKQSNSNLYFWFFPSELNYQDDPVVLWLQGGPGSSSLYGLFDENGPFVLKNGILKKRYYSWTKNHSVLYIDNPVGTGFSFTDSGGYATDQTQVGEELHEFLQQFFKLFPELQKNDFFISGESYAGKYIPALAHAIKQRKSTASVKINLEGLAIGNGLIDPVHQLTIARIFYQLGLIDLRTKGVISALEGQVIGSIKNEQWLQAVHVRNTVINECLRSSGLPNIYNYLDDSCSIDEIDENITRYLDRNDLRRALHVGRNMRDSSNVYGNLRNDVMKSVAPWVDELLDDYKILFYSGQLDLKVPYLLTAGYLQNLNYSKNHSNGFNNTSREQWNVNGKLAGYVREAGNLIEVLVRNAGHMVPRDQPEWASDLIYKFTRNMPFH